MSHRGRDSEDQEWKKRLFGFIMFIFTLVETGSKESPPIITIPAG
jgi:hypothetical protein